jgi:hypothetical protein
VIKVSTWQWQRSRAARWRRVLTAPGHGRGENVVGARSMAVVGVAFDTAIKQMCGLLDAILRSYGGRATDAVYTNPRVCLTAH